MNPQIESLYLACCKLKILSPIASIFPFFTYCFTRFYTTVPEKFWQSVRCRAQTEHSYYFTLFLEVLETRRGERKGEIGDMNKKNKWEIWWRGRDWFSKWNSRWERKFPTSLLGRTTVRWLREFWVCGATVWAASNQHNRNAAVKRVQLLNWESG